jgi:hypothetical protein
MHLLVDANIEFNQQPFQRTIAVKLNLISAFHKVDHNHLLVKMKIDDLGIPSCVEDYKTDSFLVDVFEYDATMLEVNP